MMNILAGILLMVTCGVGTLLAAVGLPGLWLIVLGAIGLEWWKPELLGMGVILAVTALALAAEVAELVAGSVGAKKAGGSPRAGVGAIVGGIVGGIVGTVLIPIPVIGTILGAALGAAGLAAAMQHSHAENRGLEHTFKVGTGAFVGRLAATAIKAAFGVVMSIVVLLGLVLEGW